MALLIFHSSCIGYVLSLARMGLFHGTFKLRREDPALQEQARMAKITARLQIDNNIYDYLRYSYNFDSPEINRNKKTLIEGQNRIPDFIGFLAELKNGARMAKNPKGYVIGAIKKKLRFYRN